MKTGKITRETADSLYLLPFGRKHPVYSLIESLKPGEMLFISRSDFNWKRHTPNIFCKRLAQKGKGKFVMLKSSDKSGWVVERLS